MTTMKVLVFVVLASVGVLNAQMLNSDMALAMLLGNQNGGGGGGNLLQNLVMMKTLGDAGPALMLAMQNQRRFRDTGAGPAAEGVPNRGDAGATRSNALLGLRGLGGAGGISPLLLALSAGDTMKKIAPLLLLQQNRI
ncbi:hypothetical protein LOTGIDRAFT_239171 [Lottia gigantea]|uniref:Uncharacterized protein n=1 Tax=Lottia gigantea TaxID=225164 RepID=V4C6C3_LOTGI|nr:hypothetical protein LOTGIDRAFT_239171 [Lottia gigantea]ESO97204.1 hypothetical protein LOTGIDRAFT_239171 [Lottia gigantea]